MAKAWMQAKLYKIKKARTFTPHDTKNRAGHTIEGSNALSLEVSKVTSKYTGTVTRGALGPQAKAEGKTKRVFDARTYGNGTRITNGASQYYDLWATDDRLISMR